MVGDLKAGVTAGIERKAHPQPPEEGVRCKSDVGVSGDVEDCEGGLDRG
jgi:hypothetical protein